jgi:hypothetical protein
MLAGGLLSACGIEDTPHAPTFATDIKPIMLSRCVRCHGAGGHLNTDSHTTNPSLEHPIDGFFDRMEDDCPDAETFACHGLGHYTTGGPEIQLISYIHRTDLNRPMPPPPAPALTTHQLDVIDLWLANGAPAE